MGFPPDRVPENTEGTVIFRNLICAVPIPGSSLLPPPARGRLKPCLERIEEVELLWVTKLVGGVRWHVSYNVLSYGSTYFVDRAGRGRGATRGGGKWNAERTTKGRKGERGGAGRIRRPAGVGCAEFL